MNDGEVGEVRVGAREIYDAVQELRSRVDISLTGMEPVKVQAADHEDRIRGLERWRYALPISALVAAGSAAASVAAIIVK